MYHTLVLAPPLTSCVLRNRKAWVSQGNNNSNLKHLTTSKAILGSTKKLLTHSSPHLAFILLTRQAQVQEPAHMSHASSQQDFQKRESERENG